MGAVAVVSRVSEGLNFAFDLARLRDVIWVNPHVLASGSDSDELLSQARHSDRDHTSMLRALYPTHLSNIVAVVVVTDPLNQPGADDCVDTIRAHSAAGVMSVVDVSAQQLRDAQFSELMLFQLADQPKAVCH